MPVLNATDIHDKIVADIQSILLPASEYAIHKSYGVSGGPNSDSEEMRERYGRWITGFNLLRGWWVEWQSFAALRPNLGQRIDRIDRWGINGIYQILNKDSDTMYQKAMTDIHLLSEYWRLNPTFQLSGISLTVTMPDAEAGIQYEANTQTPVFLAGSQVYMPVLTLSTRFRQG